MIFLVLSFKNQLIIAFLLLSLLHLGALGINMEEVQCIEHGGIFVVETLKYNVNGRQRSVITSLEFEIN